MAKRTGVKTVGFDPSVNPSHYQKHASGLQAIQITEHMSGNVAQAVQYLWRLGLKNDALSDLRKSVWFCNRELMRLGGESMLKDGLEGPPVLKGEK